jgi:hypothetical protein
MWSADVIGVGAELTRTKSPRAPRGKLADLDSRPAGQVVTGMAM